MVEVRVKPHHGKTVAILRSLKVLDLSHNSLERLDKAISSLRSLEMINVSHNNLAEEKHFTALILEINSVEN